MGIMKIEGVIFTPQKIIPVPGGDVYRAVRLGDVGFTGFGEAYFSTFVPGAVKAWKRHRVMTLNLVVPVGSVLIVMVDTRLGSVSEGGMEVRTLAHSDYGRLTVPPGIWFGMKGLGLAPSIILNVADIVHDPDEVDRKNQDEIAYAWDSSQ
ncbi:MAG: dTDP-4-dehydrorhamnose 3,5-epimerase [Gammaproteobacteria bacterium]|nr:dTDP-4-dehydrorhamnose 3,5-epimerase [Gammaproteobacteria bacterium]